MSPITSEQRAPLVGPASSSTNSNADDHCFHPTWDLTLILIGLVLIGTGVVLRVFNMADASNYTFIGLGVYVVLLLLWYCWNRRRTKH